MGFPLCMCSGALRAKPSLERALLPVQLAGRLSVLQYALSNFSLPLFLLVPLFSQIPGMDRHCAVHSSQREITSARTCLQVTIGHFAIKREPETNSAFPMTLVWLPLAEFAILPVSSVSNTLKSMNAMHLSTFSNATAKNRFFCRSARETREVDCPGKKRVQVDVPAGEEVCYGSCRPLFSRNEPLPPGQSPGMGESALPRILKNGNFSFPESCQVRQRGKTDHPVRDRGQVDRNCERA